MCKFDFSSLSQAFNHRNFKIGSNIEDMVSLTMFKSRTGVRDGCDSCGKKFSLFKRKRTCVDCSKGFCNGCLIKDSGFDGRNRCKRCRVFRSVPLDKNELLLLRARDLKWFLATKRIPYQTCIEKSELVDLIIQSNYPQTSPQYSSLFNRHENNASDFSPETQTSEQIPNTNNSFDRNEQTLASNSNSRQSSPDNNPLHQERSQMIKENVNKLDSSDEPIGTHFNIDDVSSLEQIKGLSVRQLKLVLTRNFIDYKGCVEKEELMEKVNRLWTDRQLSKQQNVDEIPDSSLCKICMQSTIDCALLECGHMVSCTDCGKRLGECPICRQYVVRVVHIFQM